MLSLLDAGERGQYADLQWFYHYMERSDAMVFSVMQRRRAALIAREVQRELDGHDAAKVAEGRKRGESCKRCVRCGRFK